MQEYIDLTKKGCPAILRRGWLAFSGSAGVLGNDLGLAAELLADRLTSPMNDAARLHNGPAHSRCRGKSIYECIYTVMYYKSKLSAYQYNNIL